MYENSESANKRLHLPFAAGRNTTCIQGNTGVQW